MYVECLTVKLHRKDDPSIKLVLQDDDTTAAHVRTGGIVLVLDSVEAIDTWIDVLEDARELLGREQ